jgi:HD-GYP domain-containing protein (c-di-GMP phosphodiesterase class II)
MMRQGNYTARFLEARPSQLGYYREVPLYAYIDSEYVLYKKKDQFLSDVVTDGIHPDRFFIREMDKLAALEEAQMGLNLELRKSMNKNDMEEVKRIIVTLMAETIQAKSGSGFEGLIKTMDIVVDGFVKDRSIVEKLLDVVNKDYTTMIHSINVMVYALKYAERMKWSMERIKDLGLCALLHDVGKCEIPDGILKADRKLTSKEFDQIKKHSNIGYNMLSGADFGCLKSKIKIVAMEHHEKLDGSGYPNGIKNMCEESRIIAIIDYYEALTNDDRPYRRALIPLHALKIIKVDVMNGKYDETVFKNFIYSLI